MEERPSWYRIQNRTLPSSTAVIDLFGEIGAFGISAEMFASDFRSATAQAARAKIFINSPGGSVFDGLTILNTLRGSRIPVETYGMGMVASIASVIFQGAAPGKRFMAPNSRMMIHRARMVAEGDDLELASFVERLQDATTNIASIFAERSGKDVDHWMSVIADGKDVWYDPAEAVEAGLADAVAHDEEESENAFALGILLGASAADVRNCISNAGRTLSAANLEKIHSLRETVDTIHSGACDLGDSCPLAVKGQSTGEEPTNRSDVRRREVDRILAGMLQGGN